MKDGPFVAVDCGAIPETLIESELFGYQKGSISQVPMRTKWDISKRRTSGTLFLDEVGNLCLIRCSRNSYAPFRNEKSSVSEVREPIPVSTRIVVATNQSLATGCRSGSVSIGPLLPPQ